MALGRITQKFSNTLGAPYVGFPVYVFNQGTNSPARLYLSNGALLSKDGIIFTDNNGTVDFYVNTSNARIYSLKLRDLALTTDLDEVNSLTPQTLNKVAVVSDTGPTKLRTRSDRVQIPSRLNIRQTMPTPPTVTTGAVATLTGQTRWLVSDNASFNLGSIANDWCSVLRAPLEGNNVTFSTTPTYNGNARGFAFIHEGTAIELNFSGTTTSYLVKVDDQYVTMTPQSTGSGAFFAKYAFGSVKRRRIEIIGYNIAFNGIGMGANDSVEPAPIRGPRCIVVGDSFTAGSGASGVAANNFVAVLSDLLGWDDVWASGVGGTGYVADNSGTSINFVARLAHDVISYNPEVVWFVGSVNDDGVSSALVGAAASNAYRQIAAALPNALIVASPNAASGVNGYSSNKLANNDAMKTAIQSVAGVWVNPLELPLTFATSSTPPKGVLRGAHAANLSGATGLTVYGFVLTGGYPQLGGTIEIGSGSTRERVQVKSGAFAGSDSGRYFFTVTFDGALQYAHADGETWKQVGSSYLTGKGKVGATTGFGNADLYVSSDGVHPSDVGHIGLAENLATQFLLAVGPN